MTKALVIGFGSIGIRHARLLESLGIDVMVVSRRAEINWLTRFSSIEEALASHSIDCALVANETSEHFESLKVLRQSGFDGPVLVEKPLFAFSQTDANISLVNPSQTWVAYNLRFHPALIILKERIGSAPVISASIYAGQSLGSWREGREITDTYSSSAKLGGGVLRDLSHELDYAGWLFGPWSAITALGGKFGNLPITSDDNYDLLATTARCKSLSVHIDYYHKPARRSLCVNTDDQSFVVDMVKNSFSDGVDSTNWEIDRDHTYLGQLKAFLNLSDRGDLCTFKEGLDTIGMVEAAEKCAGDKIWLQR